MNIEAHIRIHTAFLVKILAWSQASLMMNIN